MKNSIFRTLILAVVLTTGFSMSSCKSKTKETPTPAVVDTPVVREPAPVQISTDDVLTKGVQDAVKDYPGVTATVSNGEVTLTGTIERSRLTKLMQSIQSLSPKKVNNELKIK